MESAPSDSATWEKLARTFFDLEDYDRCLAAIDSWEKAVNPRPAAIDDLRGDICSARKDPKNAERHWRAFLAKKPRASDAASTLDALADLCEEQGRSNEQAEFRARATAAEETATRRVAQAKALLRLRQWDAAFAEIKKANALDAADDQVKEWLPKFERLKKLLPRIKALDAQITKSTNNVALLLEHSRFFTIADLPVLALDECESAMKLAPGSVRARVQTGEALQDSGRPEEAAKLQVSHDLLRENENHVSDRALRELGAKDLLVSQNPGSAEPLAARSKILRDLRQFTLALADAKAALLLDENSAAAHFEAAHDLDGLEKTREALDHAIQATELKPADPVMWFYRGVIEAHRADFAAAIASQTRSLAIRDSLVARREREKAERRLGNVAAANADLQRVLELDPQRQ